MIIVSGERCAEISSNGPTLYQGASSTEICGPCSTKSTKTSSIEMSHPDRMEEDFAVF